jgi:glycosyltransferase involved in cell wall biosynthesis
MSARVERTIRRAWINHCEKKSRARGTPGLTDPRADLLRFAAAQMADADIINVHKTEHFADLPALLASLPARKPVVLTLHDLSPITGGCDYPGSCERFTNSCGSCPVLTSREERDYSRDIFRMRQAAYATRSRENFALVANSRWTMEMARRSGLTQGHRIEMIHYGLDQTVYSPCLRLEARQALDIGLDERVVAFAAHDLSLRHKGGHFLHEALKGVSKAGIVRLLTMGAGRFETGPAFRHVHFGRVECDDLQALIYRAADVFVIPSLEEAFGQTALEAVACGTVVAGFDVGGIGDIVHTGLNGRLVEPENSSALALAITELVEDHDLRSRWKSAADAWVRAFYSYAVNANSYISLYESLLKAKAPR